MVKDSTTPIQNIAASTLSERHNGTLRPARDIRAGNFAWLAKSSLTFVQESFSESNNVASALAVYLALAWLASDHADTTFQASKGLIAYRAGVSIRTAGDVLKKLEGIGLVRVERQTARSGYPDAPNYYTLLAVGNSCLPVGDGCSPVGNERLQSLLPTCINKGEQQTEQSERTLPSSKTVGMNFDAIVVEGIYQAYPRRVSKGDALKAIAKALATLAKRANLPNPAGWLLNRVQDFAKSPAGQAGKYTPYPATWFSAGRYDDDPAEWQNNSVSGHGVKMSAAIENF